MGFSIVYDANRTALSKSANLFAGDVNEFVASPTNLTIYSVASAIGMRMTVFVDSDIVVDDKEIPFIGTTLVKKDHYMDTIPIDGGRISVFLRETANVATTDTYVGIEV
jgi:hypothetical protein